MKHLLFLKGGIFSFIQHIFIPYVPTLRSRVGQGTSSFKVLQDDRVETESAVRRRCDQGWSTRVPMTIMTVSSRKDISGYNFTHNQVSVSV